MCIGITTKRSQAHSISKQLSSEHLLKHRIKQNNDVMNVLVSYESRVFLDIDLLWIAAKADSLLARSWLKAYSAQPQIYVSILAKHMEVRFFFSKVFCTDLPQNSWWEKCAKLTCSLSKLRGGSAALWGGGFCLFAFREQIIFWDQLVLRNSPGNRFFFP